jgi:hypothetical protein
MRRLPPVPPHRGAGHFNCDRWPMGLIEDYGTTGQIAGMTQRGFRMQHKVGAPSHCFAHSASRKNEL